MHRWTIRCSAQKHFHGQALRPHHLSPCWAGITILNQEVSAVRPHSFPHHTHQPQLEDPYQDEPRLHRLGWVLQGGQGYPSPYPAPFQAPSPVHSPVRLYNSLQMTRKCSEPQAQTQTAPTASRRTTAMGRVRRCSGGGQQSGLHQTPHQTHQWTLC